MGEDQWEYFGKLLTSNESGVERPITDVCLKIEGGPDLIYDHQMCMDTEKQMLYVFGGRTVNPDTNQHNYSGLYRYNVNTNSWKLLR